MEVTLSHRHAQRSAFTSSTQSGHHCWLPQTQPGRVLAHLEAPRKDWSKCPVMRKGLGLALPLSFLRGTITNWALELFDGAFAPGCWMWAFCSVISSALGQHSMKPAIRSKVYCCLANVYWVISKTWCQVIVMCCSGKLCETLSVFENSPLRILQF